MPPPTGANGCSPHGLNDWGGLEFFMRGERINHKP